MGKCLADNRARREASRTRPQRKVAGAFGELHEPTEPRRNDTEELKKFRLSKPTAFRSLRPGNCQVATKSSEDTRVPPTANPKLFSVVSYHRTTASALLWATLGPRPPPSPTNVRHSTDYGHRFLLEGGVSWEHPPVSSQKNRNLGLSKVVDPIPLPFITLV